MPEKPIAQMVVESDELAATKQLLDHADSLLGGLRFIDRDVHVLTAVLAPGVEKLLKLTYGLTLQHREGLWPASAIQAFQHRVADLDAECRRLLRDTESSATNPGVVVSARTALDTDAWMPSMLRLLQRYATRGRFYNLDFLGHKKHLEPSPRELWHRLDHETWIADPGAADVQTPNSDDNEWRRAEAWQMSVRRWREYYYQCWVQQVCGPEARHFAYEVRGPVPT